MAKKNTSAADVAGNVSIGLGNKKRFSVNGDLNTVIEFDPSDLGVANRLSKSLSLLSQTSEKWEELNKTVDAANEADNIDSAMESMKEFSKQFDELEGKIRETIDFVFDSEIADKLLGNSSAFSPVNGKFKYEHIIESVLKCYEQQVQDEAPKFNKRKITKYTNKYIRK